jgi:hypothetical protein
MADPVVPERGAIVTYLDPQVRQAAPWQRGVACGTAICDPRTNEMWIPVLRPDRSSTLVDPALVAEVAPAPQPVTRADRAPVDVLREAVATAAAALSDLDDDTPRSWHSARTVLSDLLDTIAPIQEALSTQARSEPDGILEVVLGYLTNAAAHLDVGDIAGGREAVVVAHTAITRMTER